MSILLTTKALHKIINKTLIKNGLEKAKIKTRIPNRWSISKELLIYNKRNEIRLVEYVVPLTEEESMKRAFAEIQTFLILKGYDMRSIDMRIRRWKKTVKFDIYATIRKED